MFIRIHVSNLSLVTFETKINLVRTPAVTIMSGEGSLARETYLLAMGPPFDKYTGRTVS